MKIKFIVKLIGLFAIGVVTGIFLPIYDRNVGVFSFGNELIVAVITIIFMVSISAVGEIIKD